MGECPVCDGGSQHILTEDDVTGFTVGFPGELGGPITVRRAAVEERPYLLNIVQVYIPSSSCWTFCSLNRQFLSPRLVNALSWVKGHRS